MNKKNKKSSEGKMDKEVKQTVKGKENLLNRQLLINARRFKNDLLIRISDKQKRVDIYIDFLDMLIEGQNIGKSFLEIVPDYNELLSDCIAEEQKRNKTITAVIRHRVLFSVTAMVAFLLAAIFGTMGLLGVFDEKGPIRTGEQWDMVFERAANELTNSALFLNNSVSYIREDYSYFDNIHLGTIEKSANTIKATSFSNDYNYSNYYLIENEQISLYYSLRNAYYFDMYGMQTGSYVKNEAPPLIDFNELDGELIIDELPCRYLKDKFKWFTYKNGSYILKNEYLDDFNTIYLNAYNNAGSAAFNIELISFKIADGRIKEHSFVYNYDIGRYRDYFERYVGGVDKRFVYRYGDFSPIKMPEVSSNDGVFALNLFFSFNEEQYEFLTDNLTGNVLTDNEILNTVAQSISSSKDGKNLFGSGGIYEELENALNGQSETAALAIFNVYLNKYGDDSGMETNKDGYFVPLSGYASYLDLFTDLSRTLYFSNPEAFVGNAFIENKLAYCVTQYGVHIVMINSYYSYSAYTLIPFVWS